MKKLCTEDYIKMQNLAIDYAMGKISEKDKEFFESNIKYTPELVKEVEEIKNVFGTLDKLDLERIPREKSRNLSVKVVDKIYQTEKKRYHIARFAVPFGALAIFIFIMMNFNKKSDIKNFSKITEISTPVITNSEVDSISSMLASTKDLAVVLDNVNSLPTDLEDLHESQEIINSINNETIYNSLKNDKKIVLNYLNKHANDASLLEDLDKMDESDFQSIYKVMQNEKFNL